MEVLLEMVAQGEVEKRSLLRGQLHRGGQATLNHREIARGKVPVEVVDVGDHFESLMSGSDPGSIRGPATTIMRRSDTRSLA